MTHEDTIERQRDDLLKLRAQFAHELACINYRMRPMRVRADECRAEIEQIDSQLKETHYAPTIAY